MKEIDQKLIKIIFGLKLKQTRVDQDMSLSELSDSTGISKSYLTEIEQGKKYPKPDKILKLAKTLNVSYDYLISLQLNRKLSPITDLIESGFLKSIPLEFVGIDESELIKLLASAPTKLSAFISSLIQIAGYYDIRLEEFYFSVLRSYQEMHDNYFEDLENEATVVRKKYEISNTDHSNIKKLEDILRKKFNYQIIEGHPLIDEFPELRYLVQPQKHKTVLFLNSRLNISQKAFTFSREIGFSHLKIENRPYVSSWIETDNFELILNNFKAFYFGSALLLNDREYIKGLTFFLNQKVFLKQEVLDVINRNNVTPEVFMLRLTSLVPRYLRYNDFIFFRYNKDLKSQEYFLTKELYGTGIPPVMNRSFKVKALLRNAAWHNLENYKNENLVCDIRKVKFENSEETFMIIGISQNMEPSPHLICYNAVAFRINKKLREKVSFLDDPKIKVFTVNKGWIEYSNKNCHDGLEHSKGWFSSSRKDILNAKIAKYFNSER